MGVGERGVSSLSQPSDNPPTMDGLGSNSVHPPAHGFLTLLQETPDYQDLGADVMVPDRFASSTPPPVYTDDRFGSPSRDSTIHEPSNPEKLRQLKSYLEELKELVVSRQRNTYISKTDSAFRRPENLSILTSWISCVLTS